MNPDDFQRVFNLPFTEAESFFKQKLNIPTKAWTDLWEAEHAKGFMSAGAYHADLLSDLRSMVDKAIAGGMTKDEFRKQFKPLVSKYGWQLKGGGPAWRSDLIWQTNRATAFAAGRWQQMESAGIEYLRYVHADGVAHPRPKHLAMHGTVRKRKDAFWKVNYPPQGFRCHCRAEPVTAKEYADTPASLKDLPDGWESAADPGWGYNVGEAGLKRHEEILTDKMTKLPPDIAEKLRQQMANMPSVSSGAGSAPQVPASAPTPQPTGLAHTHDVKDYADLHKLMQDYAQNNPSAFVNGYTSVTESTGQTFFMATDPLTGRIGVNNAAFSGSGGINPSIDLISGLQKIRQQQALTFNEEYSLESLWHEINHNRAKKYVPLPKGSSNHTCMEALNQFVSRHTYDDFVKSLGGTATHKAAVLENGYGYDIAVKNFRSLLDAVGVKEEAHLPGFEKILFDKSHNRMKDNLASYISKASGKPKNDIGMILDQIGTVAPTGFERGVKAWFTPNPQATP